MNEGDRLVKITLTRRHLDILIQGIKNGRVEFTERAALLVHLEDSRDTDAFGYPLVRRDPYVGGPTAYITGHD